MLRNLSKGTPRWQHNFSLSQTEQEALQKALAEGRKKDKYFSLKDLLMIAIDLMLKK